MKKKKIRMGIRALLEGIVFLPLHSDNVERVERVKRVWRGRNIFEGNRE